MPEGFLKPETKMTLASLERAKCNGDILEAKAVCSDENHNLIVDLDGIKGIIPREEAAIGISDGSVRDIALLSRVNRPVCFKVKKIYRHEQNVEVTLSRREAQEEARRFFLDSFSVGDVTDAVITHLEPFGAFADIGCGIVGLINIENISVSRISHPKDRFFVGQKIKTVIKEIDYEKKRFTLSHKELLGTWEENISSFQIGQTVGGTVRSVEPYGIFIELTPNLAGLAEYSEDVVPGEQATVYVKNIIPEKMKVKLSIINHFREDNMPQGFKYFIKEGKIDCFRYSPSNCVKKIETVF